MKSFPNHMNIYDRRDRRDFFYFRISDRIKNEKKKNHFNERIECTSS